MYQRRTAISLRLSVIPSGSGFARSVRPSQTTAHHRPNQNQMGKDAETLPKLLEYVLNQYQQRIDQLKELKPGTVGYENLMNDIDGLQVKLEQLRQQIAARRK